MLGLVNRLTAPLTMLRNPAGEPHAFRRLSTLVDENVHPRVMQGRAGHASSKLTMELYAHVTDDADREAANALEKRFRPAFRDRDGHAAGTEGR